MKANSVYTLCAALFAATLWFGCDDEEPLTCSDCGGRPLPSIQIVTGTPNDTLYYIPNDTASTSVTVIVTDMRGLALPGQQVDISLAVADLGVIEYTDPALIDTTNALGRVDAVFRVYDESGEQIISATTGGITAQRTIVIRELGGWLTSFVMYATPQIIETDSNESVQSLVTFTIVDENNRGVPNALPVFSVTGGTIDSPSPTDSSGRSSFFWTFYNEFGDFYLRAQYGNFRDTVMVRVLRTQGPGSFNVTAEPIQLEADSSEEVYSLISIRIQDGFGQGVPNASVIVSATGGNLSQPSLSDANGLIQFDWSFLDSYGTFQLFAQYDAWGLRDTVNVEVRLRE